MKKLISHILVALLLAVSISAQENQPVLFDEFGQMSGDDMNARLDNLALEISKTPQSKALVRIYGGEGNDSYIRGSILKGVWSLNRKYPPERLLIQFCNVNKESLGTRFFVVRENDKVETCDENLTVPKETVLLETAYFEPYINWKFEALENNGADWESLQGGYSEYSQDALKRLLKDSPESKVYIIAYTLTNFEKDYNGKVISKRIKNLDKKYIAQKMLRSTRSELLKKGVSRSQIITINGGYISESQRRLEFWFVPQGGEIPKPKPDYVPKKRRNK
jgi:hypothetical protein